MDIAVLDERGIIREVRTVSEVDYVTDHSLRTVALPDGHDMTQHLGVYAWDYLRGCFLPVSVEPLDVAEREQPGLVETLVAIADELHAKGIVTLSKEQRAAMSDWRMARR